MTNFHLYLSNTTVVAIFLNVCMLQRTCAQTWQALTLKNCVEPLHMLARPMLLHRMALVFSTVL